jgi:hypothetical protein
MGDGDGALEMGTRCLASWRNRSGARADQRNRVGLSAHRLDVGICNGIIADLDEIGYILGRKTKM